MESRSRLHAHLEAIAAILAEAALTAAGLVISSFNENVILLAH